MINLEVPKKFTGLVRQAHQVSKEVLRANSRKYDLAEHAYPKELDMLAALVDGMNDGGGQGAGAARAGRRTGADRGHPRTRADVARADPEGRHRL